MSINNSTVSGRIARDPELRSLPSGDSVFENAVAVEHYKKDAENEVSFFNFKVYGKFADLLASKIKKGDLVVVSGYLKESTWEAKDGSKRSRVELIAHDVEGEFKFRTAGEESAAADQPAAAADDIPF